MFDADKTQDIFSKFDTDPEEEFNGRGTARKRGYEENFEPSNRRTRKSARSRFVSRR